MLASKVIDSGLLDQLAPVDVKAAETMDAVQSEVQVLCDDNEVEVMSLYLQNITDRGFLGRTRRQMEVLFEEIGMLQQRLEKRRMRRLLGRLRHGCLRPWLQHIPMRII